jgi:hypothetical protein
MFYAVMANIVIRRRDGYTALIGMPTFFLDSDVQGIVNEAHALFIAQKMLNEIVDSTTVVNVTVSPVEKKG